MVPSCSVWDWLVVSKIHKAGSWLYCSPLLCEWKANRKNLFGQVQAGVSRVAHSLCCISKSGLS